jgi:hypothetical protein
MQLKAPDFHQMLLQHARRFNGTSDARAADTRKYDDAFPRAEEAVIR